MISEQHEASLDTLFKRLEEFTGLTLKSIRNKTRARDVAIPRQVVGYVMRTYLGMSLKEVATYLLKDHSSICYYVRKHEDSMFYPPYKKLYRMLIDELETDVLKIRDKILNEKINILEKDLCTLKEQSRRLSKQFLCA